MSLAEFVQPHAVRPAAVHVKPRNLRFNATRKTPHHWVRNDPFLTHYLNALSLTFPHGEREFIESVKAVRNLVKNPATRSDVAGFIAQEALHSREHGSLNEVLREMGYPVQELQREFSEMRERRVKGQSKKMRLAMTVAIEHLTALMGRVLLEDASLRELIHPDVRGIWLWHGMEELEHKAVAFDVYQEVFGDHALRVLALLVGSAAVFSYTHYMQYRLLDHEGLANNPLLWVKGLWRLWGPRGILSRSFVDWLDFLRPGFHPWEQDDTALIVRMESQLAELGRHAAVG